MNNTRPPWAFDDWVQRTNPDESIHWHAPSARISPSVFIGPEAKIYGGKIYGGEIYGGAILGGVIYGGVIYGGAILGGVIHGGAIHGGAIYGGVILGGAILGGAIHGGAIHDGAICDAAIRGPRDVLIVGPVGNEPSIIVAWRSTGGAWLVQGGCSNAYPMGAEGDPFKAIYPPDSEAHAQERLAALEFLRAVVAGRAEL